MIPATLPTYTVAQLETKAESLLKEYFGDAEFPVDVDLLVELRDNTELDYWPGLQKNHGVLGAVFLVRRQG